MQAAHSHGSPSCVWVQRANSWLNAFQNNIDATTQVQAFGSLMMGFDALRANDIEIILLTTRPSHQNPMPFFP